MRPEILFTLFSAITGLPGIGPKVARLVEKLAGEKRIDLLWLLPREIIDRRHSPKIAQARLASKQVREQPGDEFFNNFRCSEK